MSISEIFFMTFPIAWIIGEAIFLKPKNLFKWASGWMGLSAGCLLVSLFMIRKLSVMMGGGFRWSEVLFYAWFLFALFIILRIFKKGVLFILERIIRFHHFEKIRKFLINTLSFILLFIIAVPFFLAMTTVHRPKIGNVFNPQTAFGINYENITLKTKDHLNIKGWFVPAPSDKAVIIAHGLGANKSNFVGTVDMWHQLGFNVLIFDFRGHGDSDGHTVSFGYKERYDVLAALDYIQNEKKFLPENIWGYGVSFGGAAMIHAANEAHQFRALIIDSSFADLDHMATKIIEGEAIIPGFCRTLIKNIGLFFVQLDLGFDLCKHSPQNAVHQLTDLPILFIHGKGDPLISWKETQLLYENANDPKQIAFFNTEGHYGTPNDPNYIGTIQKFLLQIEKIYAKKL